MSVNEIFNQLSIHTNNREFEKIYSLGVSLLSRPNAQFDLSLFQKSVVSIIQNDKYSLALKLIESLAKNQSKQSIVPENYLIFEKLYIFYKLNDNQSFEKLFQTIQLGSIESKLLKRSILHLQAQQFYKLGYYNNALEIYKQLLDPQSNYFKLDDLDLLINEKAIASQRKVFATEVDNNKAGQANSSDSYDLLFNNSLIEFNEKHFTRALDYLASSKEKAETYYANEGDSTSLDLFLEVAPMYLQSAYIYQVFSKNEESLNVLTEFKERFHNILTSTKDVISKDKNVQLFKLIFLNNYYSLTMSKNNNVFNENILANQLKYTNLVSALSNNTKFLKSQYYALKRNESILNFKIGKNISVTKELNYDTSSTSSEFKKLLNSRVVDDNENYDLTILALSSLQDSGIVLLEDLNIDDDIRYSKVPNSYYKYLIKEIARQTSTENIIKAKKLVAGSLLTIQLLVNSSKESNLNSYLNNSINLLEQLLEVPLVEKIVLQKYYGVISLLINLYELVYNPAKYFTKFEKLYNKVYDSYIGNISVEISNKFQYNFLKKINFDFFNLNENNLDAMEKQQNVEKIVNVFEKLLVFNPQDKLISILVLKIKNGDIEFDENSVNLLSLDELTEGLEFNSLTTTGLESVLKEYSSTSGFANAANNFVKKAKRVRKKPQHPSKAAIEGKPLDHERWFPMKDRSYYKVSKKDKKKMKAATQGSSGAIDHTTEESGISNSVEKSTGGSSAKKNKKKKANKKK